MCVNAFQNRTDRRIIRSSRCAPAIVNLCRRRSSNRVLPPYQPGAVDARTGADNGPPVLQNMTVGDVLAQQARIRLAEKGFEVISPSAVKVATKDRVPTSPEMAAQILREANLDAVALTSKCGAGSQRRTVAA